MKMLLILLFFALSLHINAQTSYIEVVSHNSMSGSFVYLDIGKGDAYYIHENGKEVKFLTGLECVRWLSLKGWRLVSAFSHEIDRANWLVGRDLSPIAKCYVICKDFVGGADPADELELFTKKEKSKRRNEKKSKSNDDMYQ